MAAQEDHERLLEESNESNNFHRTFKARKKWQATVFIAFCVAFVSFALGWNLNAQMGYGMGGKPVTSNLFKHNELFSGAPSPESNRAWLSLFPPGHGFVISHITQKPAVLSVFHQLHCIDVLRAGYYVALNNSYTDLVSFDKVLSRQGHGHEHITHCFDYLRQSVQCCSDLTLEPVDFARGGATGWNVEHICHDWQQVESIAREWEIHKSDLYNQ